MDETDWQRAARDKRFKYIRNYWLNSPTSGRSHFETCFHHAEIVGRSPRRNYNAGVITLTRPGQSTNCYDVIAD